MAKQIMFKEVDPQLNLPKLEEEILDFWDENKIFEKSLENRQNSPLYVFYDGPPFATGTPHYGHIVASLMKDVIPRYQTMKGKLVERKWGWDCHGLPIENIAEKELGIKNKKQIEEMGVSKFNEFCRSKVLQYTEEWKKVIRRLGRWADMDNSYKTMDKDFMESVWWVFKQLWDKNLVYEDYRSIHICPRCETTLSQSEVAEGYKDIKDLSIIAEFRLVDEPNTSILAWTTTPWTLIGNVALAVGSDIDYVKIEKKDQGSGELVRFILAKDRLKDIFPDDEYKIVDEFHGEKLVGKKYQPLFDFYLDKNLDNKENLYKIVSASFVSTEDGTGVVHIAPAFGEDDINLAKENNLPFIQHIGMDGIIKSGNGEFSGLSVKPAEDVQLTDVAIIKYLASKDLLFDKAQYEHSYPHCWRCETPLINYATSSWFVAVEKVKAEMLENAKSINWFPKHIKTGRFGMWLEGARDWSISRQRYWASVMPIWRCEGKSEIRNSNSKTNSRPQIQETRECGNIKVFGSVSELEELSGQKVDDLHKHIVDKVTFKCSECGGAMKRIPDVLDTWFDSGSMPYAQMHYPFENKEKFENNFPAEFIAEGVDQTRAWFYYLHVLSTAIMEKPAFKNVIVNGIVLAEDGKKMSKRLKNYPDPMEVFSKYGADVLRLYLLSSPVMAAESLNLNENELKELQRGFFRMLWNSYYFFTMYATLENWQESDFSLSDNILDRWIIIKIENLNLDVEKNIEKYNLPAATRKFFEFVDDLSNWYIRRNRKRFWKSEDQKDKDAAFQTLNYVLIKFSQILAPFAPFISEEIYKNLSNGESVHLTDFPIANQNFIDQDLLDQMENARKIVEVGLSKRAEAKIKVRQPLALLKYKTSQLSPDLESIIADEVNVETVEFDSEIVDDVELNIQLSPKLLAEGKAREFIRQIQSLRKKTNYSINDRIEIYYQTENSELSKIISEKSSYIREETLSDKIFEEKPQQVDDFENSKIDGESIYLGVRKV
ncbi:isoleucine--tRNA ligase [Candidatus Berkelbacteria bacterium CG08_land_8_20_14_0_20_39_8]|uniref:Isoleucine--tRNA ligase n=1 Tax=Candidatus Berkelbacteria bacterium CG08_land_8_20_14_0_20_39_8 TaxID=1974511 RepID=A0A2M6YCC1_9BACT|nr:MAG: isoleucine--tRNA ligase [Candidatus Berkelbacteria bacterium CG08_land_8_20_14_0_20_39_8]